MTGKMRDFLEHAAGCEHGKGIFVVGPTGRIASKAVNDGYGWKIEAPFKVFIINDSGREALKGQS